ncbi:MAG: sigma-70 family RNA polymerase sigma factor [Phycisphaerae bacterium]|nr:sigma-70 family RNA polymerase sigma factor [Saprospiraceae bacterium]
MTPSGWTDELLIREIRAGGRQRNTAWEYIYKAWRGYYLSPVLRAGGIPEQVDEVLGGVIVDVEKQVLKEDFELREASLRTYFTEAIVRAWARAREIAQRRQTAELDPQTYPTGQGGNVEEDFIRQEQIERLDVLLARLGEKCRKVLMRFARGYSMREIAEELGFQNEQSAKNEKGKCHRKLLELTDEF